MSRPNLVAVSLAITTFIIGLEAAPTFNHHSHGHNAAFSRALHRHQHNAPRAEPVEQEKKSVESSAAAKTTEEARLPDELIDELPLVNIGPAIAGPFESRYIDDTSL